MNRNRALMTAGSALTASFVPRIARAAGDPIRLLSVTNENGLLAVYASGNGFFERAGLNVDVKLLSNGSQILSAVAGGAAEIGVTNPVSLATAYERGVPVLCFAPTSLYVRQRPTALLVVARDSTIRTARDVAGKTIAVGALKDIAQCATQMWLEQNGADPAGVKFVEMRYSEMPVALGAGRVDAAFCAEPALTNAGDAVRILADTYGAVAPEWLTGTFITTTAYARANPALIRRIADALRQTARWANGHPRETGAVLATAAKLDPAVVGKMRRSTYADRLLAKDLQPPIDLAVRYGLIAAPVSARDLIWS